MNSGKALPFDEIFLPEFFNGQLGRPEGKSLHIHSIPTDDYISEPIVIEIEW
jgi:hypothetical protein